MDVPGRTKSQSLPEQTPLMYNAALFYEKGKLNTRLAFNYTGAFSTELNLFTDVVTNELVHNNTDYDVFVAEMYSLDYQFSYAVSKRFNLYANVNNILNTPYRTFIGVPERPIQTTYTRQKFYVGLRFNL
jgi:outer membrane receptor protein involved in Fe transport